MAFPAQPNPFPNQGVGTSGSAFYHWPNTSSTWMYPYYDYITPRVNAICAALQARAITKAEARKMLAEVDPAFKKILG